MLILLVCCLPIVGTAILLGQTTATIQILLEGLNTAKLLHATQYELTLTGFVTSHNPCIWEVITAVPSLVPNNRPAIPLTGGLSLPPISITTVISIYSGKTQAVALSSGT